MKFALGTVQFGMDYGIQGGTRPTAKAVNEMLSLALDERIEWYDTACAYGNAERVLGGFIEKNANKAGRIKIISKLEPKAFYEKPKIYWKDVVLRNISESLRRLKVKKIEAFLLHNSEYIFDEDAVHALYCANKEGLTTRIGVSIYKPEEAIKALEYDEIEVMQIPYNVFDQRLDQCNFFEKAKEKNVRLFARSSLLQGLLLMNPDSLPNHMIFAKEYLRKYLAICREYQVSPLKAAIAYVGGHPEIDYVVFGVDNKVQLLEYIAMRNEQLTEELVKAFKKEFEDVEEKLINPTLWNRWP